MPSDKVFLSRLKKILTSPLTMRRILTLLNVDKASITQIKKRIKGIAEAGHIVRIKGGRYGLPDKMNLVTGMVQGHEGGFGFVLPEDSGQSDVFISPRNFDFVMHGDKVVVRVESTKPDGRRQGSVIRVLERAHETLAGRFESFRGGGYVIPFEKRITSNLFIPTQATLGAKHGEAVVAKITEYPSKTNSVEGIVSKVLGDMADPKVEIEIEAAKYQLRIQFPTAAKKEAKAAKHPTAKDIKGRLDLRNRSIITIDGESAKDFDDAVEVERTKDGGFKLGVHIADVSHYVKEESALDREAGKRCVSVYFPGQVLPMLPFELSNDICSLNPKVDRLTMSCLMTMDTTGAITGYEIKNSVIKTVERMTYTDVAAILDGSPETTEKYKNIVPMLHDMKELADLLTNQRREAGAIDFDLPEPHVILNITGRPENIIQAERNMAHRIIEEFMLAANRTVAGYIEKSGAPGIYRIHENPDPLKVASFSEFISTFGYHIKNPATISALQMQSVLDRSIGSPEEGLITRVLLRSMKQARYHCDNIGHFALAFDTYTHFTSPIRRYPDLIVHRILKDLIRKKRRDSHWVERLDEIAATCSTLERVADDAERDIIKLKQTQYMAERIGESFEGIISGVTAFGFFVELSEPAVEGLIKITSMPDDYYTYDEARHYLIGERTGKRFRLGDKALVRVEGVSIERRQVDFVWLLGEPSERVKKAKRKPRPGRRKTSISGAKKIPSGKMKRKPRRK